MQDRAKGKALVDEFEINTVYSLTYLLEKTQEILIIVNYNVCV